MQRTLENLSKAAYLRAQTQGHLYSIMVVIHKGASDISKLRASAEAAISALEELRKIHAAIDHKNFLLLSELAKHQSCKPE